MQMLLGTVIVLVAVAAVGRLTASSRLRGALRELFGEALPGARTGGAVPERAEPAGRSSARLEWTEVVNLTAADVASPPRPRREESKDPQAQASAR